LGVCLVHGEIMQETAANGGNCLTVCKAARLRFGRHKTHTVDHDEESTLASGANNRDFALSLFQHGVRGLPKSIPLMVLDQSQPKQREYGTDSRALIVCPVRATSVRDSAPASSVLLSPSPFGNATHPGKSGAIRCTAASQNVPWWRLKARTEAVYTHLNSDRQT
jgi:hypothetical protein